MRFQNQFNSLYSEIEKLLKRDQRHLVDATKFTTLKNEALDILQSLFGVTSRQYRVVKLTNSPATVFKVMKHAALHTDALNSKGIAANM